MAIVTFTTDFGTGDGYAGAMKGVVLSLAPDARLVDITHEIPARDVAAGAFALAQAAPWFPAGTIHLAVVDPGVGGARAEIVVEAGGSTFVGPDNGLLSLAARGPRRSHRITSPLFRADRPSATFHGRDIFAPAAGRLAAGRRADEAGPELTAIADLPVSEERDVDDGACQVLHVDTFGNLITTFAGADFTPGTWRVECGGADLTVLGALTYSDAAPGEFLAYVGSGGLVEIAVRDGSAADRLAVGRGALARLRRQS